MYEQRRGSGGVWLLALVVFLAGPRLGPALATTFPPSPPAATRPSSPHGGGRVARAPAGLSFTDAHGCHPAQDWRSARLDPRVRTLLVRVARKYPIRVSCLRTGHSTYVRGTDRISNHTVWRAVDIDVAGNRPVTWRNAVARGLAEQIGNGEYGVQPSEVGSPWRFGRRPWFSDEGHQGHLHVGFRP
jgi:hypothetical protein